MSAPASQGSSGGPVLDAQGRAVGIAVSQMEGRCMGSLTVRAAHSR